MSVCGTAFCYGPGVLFLINLFISQKSFRWTTSGLVFLGDCQFCTIWVLIFVMGLVFYLLSTFLLHWNPLDKLFLDWYFLETVNSATVAIRYEACLAFHVWFVDYRKAQIFNFHFGPVEAFFVGFFSYLQNMCLQVPGRAICIIS